LGKSQRNMKTKKYKNPNKPCYCQEYTMAYYSEILCPLMCRDYNTNQG
jgi:hypothetical protein